MSKPKIGMLKNVDISELWKHEQNDFWHDLTKKTTMCI